MVLFVRTCSDWDCEGVWKTFYWVYLNIIPSSIACLSSGRSIDWGLLRSFNFRFHTGDVISSLCCLKLFCAHQNTAPSSTSNFLWALELIQAMGREGVSVLSSSWLYNLCTLPLPPQLALHWPLFAESYVCLLVSETVTVSLDLFHCWLPRNPLPRQLQRNLSGYTQVMWLGWSAGLTTALWAKTYQVFFCFL